MPGPRACSPDKKNPRPEAEGWKPFCCHTSRRPLREEKREAASCPEWNLSNNKTNNKHVFVFYDVFIILVSACLFEHRLCHLGD
jgi:hypothetical protein